MKPEEALLLAFNVFVILDIFLILKILYGLDMKSDWKKIGIVAVVYYVLAYLILYEQLRGNTVEGAVTYFMFIVLFLMAFLFSEKHRLLNMVMVIPATLVYLQWVQVVAMLEKLIGLDKCYIYIQKDKITPMYFLQDISLFLILFFLERKGVKEEYKMRLTLGEGIFTTIFCLFFPLFTAVLDGIDKKLQDPYFSVCWVVFVLAVNIAVVYAIAHRKRARYYCELSGWQKKQFDEEYDYFTRYKNSNQEMAKFRHDWKNHVLVIQSMLQSGEYEKAEKYFEKISKTSVAAKKIITGNDMVDIIFAVKEPLFEKYDIQVEYEGNLSQLLQMESVDISILFSNLIDNAIESCSQCKGERYLCMRITESLHNWMLLVENSTENESHTEVETMQKGEIPKTTKADKEYHGFGLQNVKDIVKKYHGEMEFVREINRFTVKLIFSK